MACAALPGVQPDTVHLSYSVLVRALSSLNSARLLYAHEVSQKYLLVQYQSH